jgi:hypothetical protein
MVWAPVSRFAPVTLPEGLELNGKASQTFLRHYNGCNRSGFFYQAHRRSPVQTVAMMRGSAAHAVFERATREMVDNGEPMVPPEVAKAILVEVLSEMSVPFEEHDYLREMVHRWASEFTVDATAVIACETLMVLDIEGWEVRAKVDFAELRDSGRLCRVIDYKSARAAPTLDDVARRRPDGTLAAKSFQLVLYALVLAYGVPIRVEERPTIFGDGTERVERREPFGLANTVDQFELEFVYPGIENAQGEMFSRSMSLTRLELMEYRDSLVALLRNVERSEASGDWPATLSDAACSECSCKSECPIPRELRDHAGEINTKREASEALEVHEQTKRKQDALMREIKGFAKAFGLSLRFGRDKVREFQANERTVIRDKAGLFEAVERARLYGEELDTAKFVKTSTSTEFVVRTLTEDELREESEIGETDG